MDVSQASPINLKAEISEPSSAFKSKLPRIPPLIDYWEQILTLVLKHKQRWHQPWLAERSQLFNFICVRCASIGSWQGSPSSPSTSMNACGSRQAGSPTSPEHASLLPPIWWAFCHRRLHRARLRLGQARSCKAMGLNRRRRLHTQTWQKTPNPTCSTTLYKFHLCAIEPL